jgi:hypothetical protein
MRKGKMRDKMREEKRQENERERERQDERALGFGGEDDGDRQTGE